MRLGVGMNSTFCVLRAGWQKTALDAIVAGFSETGARIVAPAYSVNPLSNYWLAVATAVAVVPVTWWLVEHVVEPRLGDVLVDGDPALMPSAPPLTAAIDFLAPSASAKWALLAPILVPMLMSVGIAPELTQAAFRVGDGPVNLMTPLMPYFPLVLSFCRRYVTGYGVGSLMSLLLPIGLLYLALQTAMLLLWWGAGLSLGIGGRYVFP